MPTITLPPGAGGSGNIAIVRFVAGLRWNLSGPAPIGDIGALALAFGEADVVGADTVMSYTGEEWGESNPAYPLVKDGAVVGGAQFRLLDITANGKKALYGLSKSADWFALCYGVAEFEAAGSLEDGSFTVTPRVVKGAAESLGACTAEAFASTWTGGVYSAWYNETGGVTPLVCGWNSQTSSTLAQGSVAGDECSLTVQSTYNLWYRAGSVSETETVTARQYMMYRVGETVYKAEAGVTTSQSAMSESVLFDWANRPDVPYIPVVPPMTADGVRILFYAAANLWGQTVRAGQALHLGVFYSNWTPLKINAFDPYHAPVYTDSPTVTGKALIVIPYMYVSKCFGFLFKGNENEYMMGQVHTPSQLLPAETALGGWDTRRWHIAYNPVTGQILQRNLPCCWL